MIVDFRLAQDSQKNIFLKELTVKASRSILNEFGAEPAFSSLYLAGSLSRGEGSVIRVDDRLLLLSDFDFALVFNDTKSAKRITGKIPSFLKELNKKYQPLGLLSEIDCGVFARETFRSVRPTLFWYEFAKNGKLIAGDDAGLGHIHTWGYRDISNLESLILLHNRAMEQLIYLPAVFREKNVDKEAFLKVLYLSARSFCDMAKSYLLFKKIYSDKSMERLEMIKKFSGEVLDPELIENISFWTLFKMNPVVEKVFDHFGGGWSNRNEILQKIVKNLHSMLTSLWKIEAGGIFKSPFLHIGEDIWTIKPASICSRSRAWLSYGKNELLRKGSFPLHKIPYYIMFNHTPMWASHLAGMILYNSFFEYEKHGEQKAKELFNALYLVAKRLPNASQKDLDRNSFYNSWNNLRKATLTIWSMIALGGRKEIV